ncbi:hypothetical protein [Haloplanus aerogenes]|uniref:Uncharacterized protein n=1 Tax=Haloplanus aerogenes TaxID=660522 RepID=A0A3M0DSB4_9EURY|nr:hypothetical protein [Haloplanus aerogenes]AZH26279.1 hypothetical protein DU502_13305 [Haloplanus aerogenes]RMB18263.1 hypothetical protein ATH50_1714 [Haloplanus aerogenes]
MPPTVSRRRLLASSAVTVGSLAGCLSASPESEPTTSPSRSPDRTPTRTDTDDGTLRIDALSVADFVVYPLAGNHPHVHRRTGTQYVIVRVATSLDETAVRERLTLELDGESVPLAERQPVPWERETVDLAFAVSKTATVDEGRVLFDGTAVRSLAAATVERLNDPPVFEVAEPSVSPTEIEAGQRVDATVRVDVTNTGGAGTFGASLGSSYLSGSKTLTATLDAGTERELTGEIRIVGGDDAPTVSLDWGTDEWTTTVPVVGTATAGSPSPTPTP